MAQVAGPVDAPQVLEQEWTGETPPLVHGKIPRSAHSTWRRRVINIVCLHSLLFDAFHHIISQEPIEQVLAGQRRFAKERT